MITIRTKTSPTVFTIPGETPGPRFVPIGRALALGCVLVAAALASACDDEGAMHEEHGSIVEEACEHTADGPFEDVVATGDAASAPDVTLEHTAVRIALDAASGTEPAFVKFSADDDAEFVFFLSADIPFAMTSSVGETVTPEETVAVDECSEVAVQHTFDLEVGTWTIALGPTSEDEVSLVFEEAGHEEHPEGYGE